MQEQLRAKEKNLAEAENGFDAKKIKLEHEVSLVTQQKNQLAQEVKSLERKLAAVKKDEGKWMDEERKLRKEVSRLNYLNEELTEKAEYWKNKYETSEQNREQDRKNFKSSSRDTIKMQKLSEIERKVEALATLQKESTARKDQDANEYQEVKEESKENEEAEGKHEEGEDDAEEQQEEDADNRQGENNEMNEGNAEIPEGEEGAGSEGAGSEDMLRNLTAQILEKQELKNENIIKYFKLDKIQLHDKDNEYKNLLKAMGALYFANRYSKMVPPLFTHWKEQLANLYQQPEGAEQPENRLRTDTESDPGPINYAELEQEAIGEDAAGEEGENPREEEANSASLNRPGIEIDTDLANQAVIGGSGINEEELADEPEIEMNKEPTVPKGGKARLLGIEKKRVQDEVIRVDDNFEDEEWSDKRGKGEEVDFRREMVGEKKVTRGRAKSADQEEEFLEEELEGQEDNEQY